MASAMRERMNPVVYDPMSGTPVAHGPGRGLHIDTTGVKVSPLLFALTPTIVSSLDLTAVRYRHLNPSLLRSLL